MARSEDMKTPLGRFAFTENFFKLREGDNGKKSYQGTILFDKSVDLSSLQKLALDAATAEWGDKAKQMAKDGLIKSPFLDGDSKQGLSKKTGERHAGFANTTFLRLTSGEAYKPKVYNHKVIPIGDASHPDGLYSGCYGYAVVNAFTWENKENGKGITFGVSLIQKAKEGESLGGGGGPDAEQYLDVIADEGDAPAETKTGKGAGGLFA